MARFKLVPQHSECRGHFVQDDGLSALNPRQLSGVRTVSAILNSSSCGSIDALIKIT